MFKVKVFIFLFIVLLFGLFFHFDLNQYFNPDFFLSKKQDLDFIYKDSPVLFVLAFFSFYVFCAALSIPGAALLTLVAGFLFDFFIGSLVVSLGSTAGAAVAFLISRFLLRDFIQKKFHSRLKTINKGFEKDGAFYLFSLRLIPVFPFFVINLLMGVTPISVRQFVLASFFGMLPATCVYVNAGTQLANIQSLTEIISLPIILSFCLLAILPWIMKFFLKILPFKK